MGRGWNVLDAVEMRMMGRVPGRSKGEEGDYQRMHRDWIFTGKALSVSDVVEPESTRRSAARRKELEERNQETQNNAEVRSMTLRG